MKWTTQPYVMWSTCKRGIKARKNGNLYNIDDNSGKWYIMVENKKLDKIYNSLWGKISFEDIEDAKVWCENFNWEMIK